MGLARSCSSIVLAAAMWGGAACSGGGADGGTKGAGGDVTTVTASSGSSTVSSSSSSGAGGEPSSSSSSGAGGSDCAAMYKPTGFTCSGASPGLASDVAPITSSNCAAANCHSAMESGEGMRMQLVGIIAEECDDERLLINPKHPECSYAIHKLTGTNQTGCNPLTTMPLGKPTLPASHIQTIYDWICEGAQNN